MNQYRRKFLNWLLLCLLLGAAITFFGLLRFSVVTDYFYHALVKDPERTPPAGDVIVAPADGTVLYVRHITNGVIPYVVKQRVSVPVAEHLKTSAGFEQGYLVGIYMNTQGVHINRIPDSGVVEERIVFNGPHMDMTRAETGIILGQLIPGWVTLRKFLGLDPFGIADDADYILKSARETLVVRNNRGRRMYVVRIADYYVGKILTWVQAGAAVSRGERFGMITWGSQTDLLFEEVPGMTVDVEVGDYVYGGESILAHY